MHHSVARPFESLGVPPAAPGRRAERPGLTISLRRRFLRGAAWSVAGSAVSQGVGLAISALAAQALGRETFGQFGVVQSTVGTFAVFAEMGLSLTATRGVASLRDSHPEQTGRVIGFAIGAAVALGASISAILFAAAGPLAATVLRCAELAPVLRLASALVFFNAVFGVLTGSLAGLEQFRSVAQVNFSRALIGLPLSAVSVFYWGLNGAVASLVLTSAFSCVAAALALAWSCRRAAVDIRLAASRVEAALFRDFSLPTFLSLAMVAPAMWMANAMLLSRPDGYSAAALVTVAANWRSVISFVPNVLAQFAIPLLSNLLNESGAQPYRRVLGWNFLLAGSLATALALGVFAFATPLLRLYGNDFLGGRSVLALFAASAVLVSLNNVVGAALVSKGRMWHSLLFNSMWAAVLLGAAHKLIPLYGAVGLAAAYLLAYGAHTAWQTAYICGQLAASEPPLETCKS